MKYDYLYSIIPSPFNMILLIVWVGFLLYSSYIIANEYFVELISLITKKMNLSSDIAGIILINIGNGVPDLITSLVAVETDISIVMNISMGSFVFLMTIVLSCVILSNPTQKRICYYTFYKNIIFILISSFFLLFLSGFQKITLGTSIAMIAFYLIFIAISFYVSYTLADSAEEAVVIREYQRKKKIINKILSYPLQIILNFLIISHDKKSEVSQNIPTVFYPLVSPVLNFFIFLMCFEIGLKYGMFFTLFSSFLFLGLLLHFSIKKQKFLFIPYFYSFGASLIWIYLISNEMIKLMEFADVYLRIKKEFSAVSLLAWGNCLGDLVTGVAASKSGFFKLATTSITTAPIHNVLFNLGILFTYKSLRNTSESLVFIPSYEVGLFSLSFIFIITLIYMFNYEIRNRKLTNDLAYILMYIYSLYFVFNFIEFEIRNR